MTEKIDVTPAVLDLFLYAGDGTEFLVNFTDENDQPLDVSSMTWTAQIRKTRASATASDLIIDDSEASSGIIKVHIPAEVTRGLAKSNQWDLQSVPSGTTDPLTVLQGTVTCSQDVTRAAVTTP